MLPVQRGVPYDRSDPQTLHGTLSAHRHFAFRCKNLLKSFPFFKHSGGNFKLLLLRAGNLM